MDIHSFDNVSDALEDTPAAAANMTIWSDLMIALGRTVEGWNLTQAEAARRLGVTQPRLNELLRGRIDRFSLDALVNLAQQAEISVRMEIGTAAHQPPLTASRP